MRMSRVWSARFAALAIGVASVGGLSVSASAHHSFSMFDEKAEQTVKGTVVSFKYGNPHVMLVLEAGGKKYLFEGPSPAILNNLGWRRDTLKNGDTATVRFHPLRNGNPGGHMIGVTLASGKVMSSWREDIKY